MVNNKIVLLYPQLSLSLFSEKLIRICRESTKLLMDLCQMEVETIPFPMELLLKLLNKVWSNVDHKEVRILQEHNKQYKNHNLSHKNNKFRMVQLSNNKLSSRITLKHRIMLKLFSLISFLT